MFSKDNLEMGAIVTSLGVLAVIAGSSLFDIASAVAAEAGEAIEANSSDWKTLGIILSICTIMSVGIASSGMTRTQNSQVA